MEKWNSGELEGEGAVSKRDGARSRQNKVLDLNREGRESKERVRDGEGEKET